VEKTIQQGALCSVLLTKHYSGDQVKKNEMGGAGTTFGGQERCVHDFRWGSLREENHLEDPGVEGRITLKWIFETWDGGLDLTDVAQEGNG
jgi:hypothetical protein